MTVRNRKLAEYLGSVRRVLNAQTAQEADAGCRSDSADTVVGGLTESDSLAIRLIIAGWCLWFKMPSQEVRDLPCIARGEIPAPVVTCGMLIAQAVRAYRQGVQQPKNDDARTDDIEWRQDSALYSWVETAFGLFEHQAGVWERIRSDLESEAARVNLAAAYRMLDDQGVKAVLLRGIDDPELVEAAAMTEETENDQTETPIAGHALGFPEWLQKEVAAALTYLTGCVDPEVARANQLTGLAAIVRCIYGGQPDSVNAST